MLIALALTVAAAVYNNVVNRWEPFHRGAYVPANLVFTAVTTVVAALALDLTAGRIGWGGGAAWTLAVAAIVVVFAIGMQVLARSRHAHRIADRRVAGLGGSALAWHVLARIPLGTALTEEVVFRGVLFAVWRESGMSEIGAALCSSIAFGLWHIEPTRIGVQMNDADAARNRVTLVVAGAALATTLVGLVLTWLRVRSEGLLAPLVLHAGINSSAAWAAANAARRGLERPHR